MDSSSRSNQRENAESEDLGDLWPVAVDSWGQGSTSALKSLRKIEKRRALFKLREIHLPKLQERPSGD
jgi:hypothetical protein